MTSSAIKEPRHLVEMETGERERDGQKGRGREYVSAGMEGGEVTAGREIGGTMGLENNTVIKVLGRAVKSRTNLSFV